MNSHHKNVKLTIETNPTRFRDTAFNVYPNSSVTKEFQKPGNFPALTLKHLKGTRGIT